MFQLDDLKQLDPTKIDLTRFDVRKFDVRKLDVRKFDVRKFDMPEFPKVAVPFDLPRMDLPKFDLPVERLVGLARDAAYVGIGAAVVTAKAADDRRRTLTDQVTTQVRKLVDTVA